MSGRMIPDFFLVVPGAGVGDAHVDLGLADGQDADFFNLPGGDIPYLCPLALKRSDQEARRIHRAEYDEVLPDINGYIKDKVKIEPGTGPYREK